mmetsp:Transcript_10485/g.23833  ORF Transcript_10485/g.23833 Transcript_10485/m.23833 type:complete len:1232 (+) Transcript_10485:70-3765(+)
MGTYVRDVIIENFKSYEGRVRIGPFPKFTCIVGPNGSGKSNLMEAISFVLGVQSRHLRGERLQDLAHKKPTDAEQAVSRTTSVEVIFASHANPEETISFRRAILPTGATQSLWNGAVVSAQDYQQKLEQIGILSKAQNFLIFQGDVQSLAARDGKDLTSFLEQVSGSVHYKAEYDELSVEKGRKEETLRGMLAKKKAASGEKRRLSQQHEEASQYRALEEEREKLLLEFYLYRLHCSERQATDMEEALREAEREAESTAKQLRDSQRHLQQAEQERAKTHLTAGQSQKALATVRSRLDRLAPENVASREGSIVLQQQLQHLRSLGQRDVHVNQKLEEEADGLRKKIEMLESQLKEAAEKARQELPFTTEQQKKFEDARQESARLSAAVGQQVQVVEQKLRGFAMERQTTTLQGAEWTSKRDRLQRRIGELTSSVAAAEEVVAEGEKFLQARSSRAQGQRSKLQDAEGRKETLLTERQGILQKIQDITATERQLEHERRVKRVSTDLAGIVPGVHGRVLELCEPSRRDFHVAVSVALGGSADAIFVDTAESGRQCVRYLKERMLEAMTFMPLQDLRSPPPDPRLHAALRHRQGVRSAMDCITFQEKHARGFQFLLGDVIIADSLQVGRQFAYGEMRPAGISCRVVTMDGEQISRDGNLSVQSGMSREGSTRFDFQALEATRARLETLDKQLLQLHHRESSAASETRALEDEQRRQEEQSQEARRKLLLFREELTARQAELQNAQQEVHQSEAGLVRISTAEARLNEELQSLRESTAEVTKAQFASLSAELGIEDAQQLERNWRKDRDDARSDEVTLTQRLGTARADLRMVEQSVKERQRRSIPEEIKELEAKLARVQNEDKHNKEEAATLQTQVGDLVANASSSAEAERNAEKAVAERRQEAKELQIRSAELAKRVADLKTKEEALRQASQDLMRESLIDDVEVPLLQASAAIEDVGGGKPGVAAASTALATAVGFQVDFAYLPEEKRALCRGPAVKMMEEEYRDNLQRMAVELQRSAPNMKAARQLESTQQHFNDASDAVQVAHREMKEVEAKFEEVRKARRAAFLGCFRKVASEINGVYRHLTSNSAGPGIDGGSAFLDLEDIEEPFLGGVKFSVMPPLKRYVEMGQLSGGERALAAMALLFAVYAYQQPPVLVLDEVDAPLDASNVDAVAKFLEAAPCQTIVVSLKDRLFKQSHGLMGVSKDPRTESSVVLSVDLNRFRRPVARPLMAH